LDEEGDWRSGGGGGGAAAASASSSLPLSVEEVVGSSPASTKDVSSRNGIGGSGGASSSMALAPSNRDEITDRGGAGAVFLSLPARR